MAFPPPRADSADVARGPRQPWRLVAGWNLATGRPPGSPAPPGRRAAGTVAPGQDISFVIGTTYLMAKSSSVDRGNDRGEAVTMTASNDRKRAAVMRLIRKGLLTPDEAAGLTSTPRDLVEYWALLEGIDIATTRAIYLLKVWCSELMEEQQDRRRPRIMGNAEQTRLHRS